MGKAPVGLKNEKVAQHWPPVIKAGHAIRKRVS